MPYLLTTREAAELCGVGRNTVSGWCRMPGGLHHGRHGRPASGVRNQYVIAPADLAAWLRRYRRTLMANKGLRAKSKRAIQQLIDRERRHEH